MKKKKPTPRRRRPTTNRVTKKCIKSRCPNLRKALNAKYCEQHSMTEIQRAKRDWWRRNHA